MLSFVWYTCYVLLTNKQKEKDLVWECLRTAACTLWTVESSVYRIINIHN